MSLTKEDPNNISHIVDSAKAELMVELSKKADREDVDRMEFRLLAAMNLIERDNGMRLTDLKKAR